MMKLQQIAFSIVAALLALTVWATPSYAATLSFDPTTVDVDADETFTLDVVVNSDDKEVLGVDAVLDFDEDILEIESITDGDYLEIGIKEFDTPGEAYIAGVVPNPGEAVTGEGVLVTIQFRAKSDGSATITYVCETGETNESNISENSTDAPDLIECSLNGEAVVTVGDGDSDNGGGGGDTEPPAELPRSGIVEDLIMYAIVGGVLLAIGAGAKRMYL